MVKNYSQLKNREVERLIDKDIREMRKVIKNKDRQRAVDEKIRVDMEYENSLFFLSNRPTLNHVIYFETVIHIKYELLNNN